ncbi:MAG: LysM domain-containing protein [Mycobacteriales bacterium]
MITLVIVSGFALSAPRPASALLVLAHGTADPAGPLVAAVALAGWLLLGWLALVSLLLVASNITSERAPAVLDRVAARIAPYAARRLVTAALGLSLVTVSATPALADPTYPALDWPTLAAAAGPWSAPIPAPPVRTPGVAAPPIALPPVGSVTRTVRVGDSLWRIAAQSLGPSASTAQIARSWPTWWQANRAVIGDDPDLLHPGTQLTPPPNRPSSPQP